MNEYDPERAKGELRRVEGMPSESARRLAVAMISAATFIDIAESLRIIAREAELAMSGALLADVDDVADEAEPVSFEIGDRVTVPNLDADRVFEITDFGIDQDAPFAKLHSEEVGEVRVWVEDLAHVGVENEVVTDDENGIEATPTENGIVEAMVNADEDDQESEDEEVEADFPDPLDALKKHAKKGKKK